MGLPHYLTGHPIVPWLLALCLSMPGTSAPTDWDTTVLEVVWEGKTQTQATQHLRTLLENWEIPTPAFAVPRCLSPSVEPSGVWIGGGDPGSCLWVRRSGDRYTVELLAESHDTIWKMRRHAVLKDGALRLGGPLTDADLQPFNALFLIDGDRLLSGSRLSEVSAFLEKKGCDGLNSHLFPGARWQRASADAESFCEEEWSRTLGQK